MELIGCLFHFKKPTREKIEKLGIDKKEIEITIGWGALDLIIVLPPNEFLETGIEFVKEHVINEREEVGGVLGVFHVSAILFDFRSVYFCIKPLTWHDHALISGSFGCRIFSATCGTCLDWTTKNSSS